MTSLVTILIPTYNRAALLGQAIASAQRQEYGGGLEIIILDDHSPDNTSKSVVSYLSDPRIRYIRHPANVGIATNWRLGIEQVQGEYFCILHDDDTFEPTFVGRLVEPLHDDPTLIFSFCDHWVMSEDGRRLPAETDRASAQFGRVCLAAGLVTDLPRVSLVDFAVPVGATMFRRSMVTPVMIDPAAQGAIDAWLFYQCVRTGAGAVYVAERLMNYRFHAGNMSAGSRLTLAPGHVHRLEAAVVDQILEPLWPTFRRQLRGAYTECGLALVVAGRSAEGRRHLAMTIAGEHGSIRVRVAWIASHLGPVGRFVVLSTARLKRFTRAFKKLVRRRNGVPKSHATN